MSLSDERIEEFKKICEANGVVLTFDEAREEARQLMILVQILAQPLPNEIAEHERYVRAGQEEVLYSPGPDDSQTTPPLL